MRTYTSILTLLLLLVCSNVSAYQPLPPIPPMPRPPDMPPVPPFSTEEAQYGELKDQFKQDVDNARKTACDLVGKQSMDDASAAVAELDQVTADYIKTADNGGDLSSFSARYVAAAQKARAAISKLNQHLMADLANMSIRLELMKSDHRRRFDKDKAALDKACDPLRKSLQPANDAQSAIEPIELMVQVRLAVRRMRGEIITQAVEDNERLNAAGEILEAQRKAASKP